MAIEDLRTVGELTARLTDRLGRLMPAGGRLDRLTAELTAAYAGDGSPVDGSACRAVEALAQRHSQHLELHFAPDGTGSDVEMPGWPPPDPDEVRSRGAGVGAVRRLEDGTCVVALDTLDAVGPARPYLDAAAALARGSRRLVLDLRANGGGDPGTVAAVAGWLLGDRATQLSEVIYRDRRRQWWTADRPPGSAFTGDVTVLVSARTYSSAEALAYHLAARGRVTVVGEPTRGAADHVVPVHLSRRVLGLLPEAEVIDAHSGGNWEGTGVVPDVACPAADALEKALA
ncbi:S41 family peptidase [Paractinoplanes rishiriensis]|nr:S41 family peptidase [Actinoplanes rishiriensis]